MNTIWTSVGSILFGLMALIVPTIGIVDKKPISTKKAGRFTALSFSACSISLCIQIYYAAIMVQFEAWSGLMDTMYATAFVSTALLIITILLNLILLFLVTKDKHSKGV